MEILAYISLLLPITFLVLFNLFYWLFIYPPMKKAGKTTFFKAFFLWGQEYVGIFDYEDIAQSKDMILKLKTYKILGILLGISFIVSFVLFLIKLIITGTFI